LGLSVAKKPPAKKRRAPSVPLTHRLPNPPAVWVGRSADIGWLVAAVERAPVTLVTGPGGVGKTALVQKTLHEHFPKKVDRTVFVDVPAGQPAAQVRQDLLRALAAASGESDLDWPALQADAMAATSAILDFAEAGELTVVIDDLHQSDVDEIDELLTALASFGRKSRFIATSRLTPRLPVLAGQVLTLSAMSDAELAELAHAWAPHVDANAARRAIARASGSPWFLSQLLVTGSSEHDLEREGLLSGLGDQAADFLRALALVDVPLPVEVIALISPHPGDDALLSLERRGLVTRSSGGIRLHDVARGLLARRGRVEDTRVAQAAAVLGQEDLLEARLEAVRLFARLGRMDAVAELLDRNAARFLAQGYTPRLFKILKDLADPAIDAWKLRCAAELGNPTALAQVYAPSREDATEALAWARTLRASGDAVDAAHQIRSVLDSTARGSDTANEARLLLATCLRHQGRFAEAGAALEDVATNDPSTKLARDAARALCETLGGEAPIERLLALRARASSEDHAASGDSARALAEAFAALGMMPEAAELAARSRPEAARPDLLANRESILTSATIALERGDLLEARRLADSVRAFARGSSILLPTLHHLDIARRLAAGELDGLAPLIDAYTTEVAGIDARSDVELATLRVRLFTVLARADDRVLALPDEAQATRSGREAGLFESQRRARLLATLPPAELPELSQLSTERRLSVIARLVLATLAIAAGDVPGATHHATEAALSASRSELRILEADALLLLMDALTMAGRAVDLARACDEVRLLGRAMRSGRYEREVELFEHIAKGSRIPPASLQRLAGSEHLAPVAARRARALLGGAPPLDHVDLRVLEAIAAAGLTDAYELLGDVKRAETEEGDAPWARGWGIDGTSAVVWLGDGRRVDLSGKPQAFRILEVLAERGGSASKETLVRDAWGEAEYHPLRHDGKLHVAVRKLRELIEDDPAAPTRLATSEDGYRLGGIVRWIRRS
jgi:tetratricopeptide (TPR) repeat protein